MKEATWWKIKAYGAWIAACIAVLLAYVHGFGLISHFLESLDTIHLAANIYLATLFAGVIVLAALRQWITIRKERYDEYHTSATSTLPSNTRFEHFHRSNRA
jgi:protein-S-isoprenylcysteine O-methyltransferase Ste14